MKMKKLLCVLMVLAMAASLFMVGAYADEAESREVKVLGVDPIKIAYIPMSTAGQTNMIVKLAFEDTIDPYKDTITLDWFDPGYDTQTMITMINDAVTQGYDCIITEVMDAVSLAGPIEEAEKAGVPVITLNSGVEAVHTMHLRGVDYLSGWKAGEALAELLGAEEEHNVIIIDFPSTMLSMARQSAGFIDFMDENTNWVLLEDQSIDNMSQEGANTAVRDLLTKYDDVDIIFNVLDDLTIGTMQAVQAANRADEITIYGNYGCPTTFEDLTSEDGILAGLGMSDYYTEYSTAMNYAMYFAITGITAYNAGYESTPEVAMSVWPVNRDNADLYRTLSRWDLAVEYSSK